MLVEASLASLSQGNPVQLGPGDTLRVTVSFTYKSPQDLSVTLVATISGVGGEKIGRAPPRTLEKTTTPMTKTLVVDVVVSADGITDGTYNLSAGLEEYPEATATIPNCVVLSGFVTPDIMGPILVIGIMAMMMQMVVPMVKKGG